MTQDKTVNQFNKLLKKFSHFKNFKELYPLEKRSDISRIPVTEREELYNWTVNDCPEPPFSFQTSSGSTGTPLILFDNKENITANTALFYKILKEAGVTNKRILLFANRARIVNFTTLTAWFNNLPHLFVGDDSFFKDLASMRALFNKIKPEALMTFPADFDTLLQLDKKYWSSVKSILNSGLPLDKQTVKKIKNKNKEVSLWNYYGCEEVGFIGIGKNEDAFIRVFEEGIYIEVLQSDGSIARTGEGFILITDLNNFSTPIIRYRVGDRVQIKKEGSKKYMKVLGREDNFVKIQGELTSRNELVKSVADAAGVNKFSIILTQKPNKNEDMLLVVLPAKLSIYSDDITKKLKEKIKSVKFKLVFNDKAIQKTSTGKYKNFVVDRNYPMSYL